MPTSADRGLIVEEISAGYGGTPVIVDVSVEVARGEIVTIVGPNGAGKSTLLKSVIGQLKPLSGRITLGDKDLTGMRSDHICRRSVAYVPQVRDTFPRLTVRENLELGGYTLKKKRMHERIEEVLELYPQLRLMLDRQGGHLSGGERKMLAMARAMMIDPALLVLDEPTAGLAPKLADELLSEHVARLAATGVSMLIVEQRAREAMAISQRAYVMANGRVVLNGEAARLLERPDLGEIFLGRAVEGIV